MPFLSIFLDRERNGAKKGQSLRQKKIKAQVALYNFYWASKKDRIENYKEGFLTKTKGEKRGRMYESSSSLFFTSLLGTSWTSIRAFSIDF